MILFAVAAVVALLEVGCASVSRQATNVFPEPKSDKALIYFYREKKFVGMAISYDIRDKSTGAVIGAIANGTYFYHFAEPGSHIYVASTESESARNVDVEAGKTYYIECGIEMGVLAGRPSLKLANEITAKEILPRLQFATK